MASIFRFFYNYYFAMYVQGVFIHMDDVNLMISTAANSKDVMHQSVQLVALKLVH